MKNVWIAAALAAACTAGLAKIPAPVLDDAAKAKAAETAARAAWQARIDAFQLCRAQDKVAAYYRKAAGSAPTAKDAKALTVSTAAPAGAAGAAGAGGAGGAAVATAAPAKAAAPAAAAPGAPMVAANPAVAGGTAAAPAGAATPTPCADPGPFAFNPPSQTPLETSGAHSPAGNAASPPSVRANSAEMAPAKK
jgi:hypothetical protein